MTFQCIGFFKNKNEVAHCHVRGSILGLPSSGFRALPPFSWLQRLKAPADAAQAALELIDCSQEEADDLITRGEAQRDCGDSGLGSPPRMFDLGLFTPWRKCHTRKKKTTTHARPL